MLKTTELILMKIGTISCLVAVVNHVVTEAQRQFANQSKIYKKHWTRKLM